MKYLLQTFEQYLISKLDRLLGFPREKSRFLSAHGYPLNLRNPQSFSEKICRKKIYDRNPLLGIVADKYLVKDYLADRLGQTLANEIAIPLLACYSSAEQVTPDMLPGSCILKSSHGSGNNYIVREGEKPSIEELNALLKKWFNEPFGMRSHEWAYSQSVRKVLVEQLLFGNEGAPPLNYRFHMIHGKCAFIAVDQEGEDQTLRTLFDPNWNLIDVSYKHMKGAFRPKPESLDQMLAISEQLAAPFDYIRVDLYYVDDKIYFGELTNYSGSGKARFDSVEFDFEIGRLWNIDY